MICPECGAFRDGYVEVQMCETTVKQPCPTCTGGMIPKADGGIEDASGTARVQP